jgi:hypothetical protein
MHDAKNWPGDEICFQALNQEWIERYFRIEPKEAVILADPKGTILDSGGKIFFAVLDDRCVGCCALRRMSDSAFEVAKMAVDVRLPGGWHWTQVAARCHRRWPGQRRRKTLPGNQPHT